SCEPLSQRSDGRRHLVADRVEQVGNAATQQGRGSNDADGNERGDQAVFNGGRTGLVVHETSEKVHSLAPLHTRHSLKAADGRPQRRSKMVDRTADHARSRPLENGLIAGLRGVSGREIPNMIYARLKN